MNVQSTQHSLAILGTRGIPAKHGGFETFAEKLSYYLTDRGWEVTVYCQCHGKHDLHQENWQGVNLVKITLPWNGAKGSILFDLISACHAAKRTGLLLTLGYNTAIFSLLHRFRRKQHIMNMDGLEWQRDKWSWPAKAWLYLNERAGCQLADHLIADHPIIEEHLCSRVRAEKITMIPYGADEPLDVDLTIFADLGIEPHKYVLIVARPEPENSILEMVQAFSVKKRHLKLVVLGSFDATFRYHRAVFSAASDEVLFPGAIYEKRKLAALRRYNLVYMHGHRVGGTNPSLVEAMAAGSPVLAHDNPFNLWVAGPEAAFFADTDDCSRQLDALISDGEHLKRMSEASLSRHAKMFTWPIVLARYEDVLLRFSGKN